MDLEEIKQILQLMEDNGLAEFELERDGLRIALRKPAPAMPTVTAIPMQQAVVPAVPAAASGTGAVETPDETNIVYIKSPMVGTFYLSPSPDSPPFVEIGQTIGKEDVVCILEAMKVMNEIKAEVEGRIVEVLVENAEPVEFGQPLFRVETA